MKLLPLHWKPQKKNRKMQIAIVVPCYNEEPVLSATNEVLLSVCEKLKADQAVDTRILYVDDGSSDSTWDLIETYSQKNRRVGGLKLAHNVGHQRALWAGLDWAAHHADAAISIDADLKLFMKWFSVFLREKILFMVFAMLVKLTHGLSVQRHKHFIKW